MARQTKSSENEGVNPLKVELEIWMRLQHRGELLNLYKLLGRHKDYLNKKALEALDKSELDKACIERAKAKDMDRIVDSIQNRIKELGKE